MQGESEGNAQERTTRDIAEPEKPRLELDRGVDYQRMRGLIESSLFGEPAEPLRIGRFTVLEQVGAGGMGVVYAAYDDTLDRKVAVKVLKGSASDEARERMLREARAMARLSHPNIVAVHEVGEHEGQVFLAMEFVRGRSLSEWIHEGEEPRPWREVLPVFRQAGNGLAAAHEAGLVHRDFKPHNVILGDDGTVKVLDFGLAHPTATPQTPELESSAPDGSSASSLTRTGAIVGTPAYMSPEQLRAEPATAASDQFAFCVSLFEALHGQRPFAGKRLEQLVHAVLDGEIREPPSASSVPAWVRAIVRRGLSLEPEKRHASLRELLAALEQDPALARRRWLTGLAIVALAVGSSVGLAALQQPSPTPPCEGLGAALDDVWGATRRDDVREGLLASGVPYAEDTWGRVEPRLTAYAEQWVETSTEACRAHDEGRQSEAMFDLRTVCLDSRRASLDAVVALLQAADAGVVEHAVEVVGGLPPVERCSDLEALTATVPPPEEPATARRVAEIRQQLADARVRQDAGRFEEAVALSEDALRRATPLGYVPLGAEASLRLGSAHADRLEVDRADALLGRALYDAVGVGHYEVAIEALARRVWVRSELMQLPLPRTRDDEPLVRSLLRRDPGDARLRFMVANNLAVMHERAQDRERAFALYEEALAEARSRGDDGLRDVAAVLTNQAHAALEIGELRQAEEQGRTALELAERALGPEHPLIPLVIYPVAHSLTNRGRLAEAQRMFERSVAIHEMAADRSPDIVQDLHVLALIAQTRRDHARAEALVERGLAILEPGDPLSIRLLHARGTTRVERGAVEQGLADHERALALAKEVLGDRHPMIAFSHEAVAEALLHAQRLEAAAEQLRLAREIMDREQPPDSPARVSGLLLRGELLLAAGEPLDAQAELQRASGIMRSAPEHPEWVRVDLRRGEVHEAQGDWPEAQESFAAALSRAEEYDDDHPFLAEARFGLARALEHCAQTGAECGGTPSALRQRAKTLADAAEGAYTSPGFELESRALNAWRRGL